MPIAAALVLVGAGVGTSVALAGGSTGGASTPAGAVMALLDAGANGDVLGALDALDPAERASIVPGLDSLVSELQRLDVLSPSATLSGISGVSLDFSGVTTATSYLDSSLAEVRLTGGTVTSTSDLSALPLGGFVTGLAGRALASAPTSTHVASVDSGPDGIATVEVGGLWYVSLGYTIAVDSLVARGASALPPAEPVLPAGAPSADAAVASFLDALSRFDARALVAGLAPDELGALQTYAPDFLGKIQPALDALSARVHLSISGAHYSDDPLGDSTLVKVSSARVDETVGRMHLEEFGGCTTVTVANQSKTLCSAAAR
ncbi:MAG TPA: hypothetical protein VND23_05865, partial [Acidimicrobiales bacterium]|nr:hypothetical protein [Acidimicrobiales bacterium]